MPEIATLVEAAKHAQRHEWPIPAVKRFTLQVDKMQEGVQQDQFELAIKVQKKHPEAGIAFPLRISAVNGKERWGGRGEGARPSKRSHICRTLFFSLVTTGDPRSYSQRCRIRYGTKKAGGEGEGVRSPFGLYRN